MDPRYCGSLPQIARKHVGKIYSSTQHNKSIDFEKPSLLVERSKTNNGEVVTRSWRKSSREAKIF